MSWRSVRLGRGVPAAYHGSSDLAVFAALLDEEAAEVAGGSGRRPPAGGKSLEVQASLSPARLLRDCGEPAESCRLLAAVCDGFMGGWGSPDLMTLDSQNR